MVPRGRVQMSKSGRRSPSPLRARPSGCRERARRRKATRDHLFFGRQAACGLLPRAALNGKDLDWTEWMLPGLPPAGGGTSCSTWVCARVRSSGGSRARSGALTHRAGPPSSCWRSVPAGSLTRYNPGRARAVACGRSVCGPAGAAARGRRRPAVARQKSPSPRCSRPERVGGRRRFVRFAADERVEVAFAVR